jgi:D-specific alpha-keto acid dehydrogenase
MSNIGITVYGCERDEADVFRKLSQRFGIMPDIINASVSACGAMTLGNRCISVDYKTRISEASLLSLRKAGAKYISTRSVGVNHIDVDAA